MTMQAGYLPWQPKLNSLFFHYLVYLQVPTWKDDFNRRGIKMEGYAIQTNMFRGV